jgi:hypothetical protein
MLLFRVIFERLTNTLTAAAAGFAAVYYLALRDADVDAPRTHVAAVQGMIFFAFFYAETIMANWQYTTNKTGRMELIFNSTQAPLRIIFAKSLASATVTFASMIVLYALPLAYFGLLGAFNAAFIITAPAILVVCCAVMSFNALFEFQLKQVKAVTAMLNLVFPYLAITYAPTLPAPFDIFPYFGPAHFLSLGNGYGVADVAWLYATTAVTAAMFLMLAQALVRRIRSTASVYLE